MCLGVDFLKILGANFGATLHFDFVRLCATECNVEIQRNLFISTYLFYVCNPIQMELFRYFEIDESRVTQTEL